MIDLLKIGNDRNIDLENFCFYCKVIKSIKTFHCMICGQCVEKFDHHCIYINNCLGYRNHKYFILFLFFLFCYITVSILTRLLDFIFVELHLYKNDVLYRYQEFIVNISITVFTLILSILLFLPTL
jgi:hypothetical protein